jgi:hypothetical protein
MRASWGAEYRPEPRWYNVDGTVAEERGARGGVRRFALDTRHPEPTLAEAIAYALRLLTVDTVWKG